MRRLALILVFVPTLSLSEEKLELLGCLPGELMHFQVENGFACCATRSGLLVLDVSTPGSPRPTGFMPVRDDSRGIAVRNGRAYLTPKDADLLVVDLSDPSSPQPLGSAALLQGGTDVVLVDHYAYVSTPIDWLRVYDVSDPTAPVEVNYLYLPDEGRDMELAGDRLYIAGDSGGFFVVDVSDPSDPDLLETVDILGIVCGLFLQGDYAYLSVGSLGLKILDISGPEITLVGEVPLDFGIHYGTWAEGCAVSGGYAYVAIREHGVGVVDVSDPKCPAELGYLELPGYARSIHLDGDRARVGCSFGGFCELDLSDPAAPVLDGHYGLLGDVQDLRLRDGLAYLAAGYAPAEEKSEGSRVYAAVGLHVLDLADPAWPELVAFEPSNYKALQIGIDGDLALISSYLAGARVFDISNPLEPSVWSDIYDMGAIYWDVEVRADRAYTVSDHHALQIFDLSDPTLPVELGRSDEFYSNDIAVEGDLVYGATRYAGLQILDVGDPAAPKLIGHLELGNGWCNRICLDGGRLYVARGIRGLFVYDVSDPEAPAELGSWDCPGVAQDVFAEGNLAYLSEEGGLRLLDVSDPSAMVELASSDLPRWGLAVEKMDDRVYVADSFGGLWVYRAHTATGIEAADTPGPTRLEANYPNPFTPGTTIRYHLAAAAQVDLAIFDAAGRRVRSLVEGWRDEGSQLARWDGRDDRGRRLASGVYFARLKIGEEIRSRRLVLLR
jgi:hypothetical protein